MFCLWCLVFSQTFVLSHVREVKSKTKWGCDCGTNGKSTCISDLKKTLGAPKSLVVRCECSDCFVWKGSPPERLCKCQYNC
ncbi:hypothetical protein ARALYDRAFT_323393 [Arabidopsis lyrata subsp. lyrata]|uniref:Uncharacterized protein n=1 Tax=Arabidopsis lyrata subsp. lyrata TaxID=81972 RepID=D7LRG4_ARALL|nr:hypothetical protein ARALYDRAFT_323393 [Arabidopsis lyrata subsp. lyrata]